jgi:phage terminase small subunit
MMRKPLTPMQYSFCNEYIKNGFNAYQAALHAGYSESYANTQMGALMNKPVIKDRLIKAYKKMENAQIDKLAITFTDKANILLRIIYDVIPKDGSEPKRAYYKDAIKAMAELNKMQGDYAPEKRMNMTVNATLDKLTEARKAYEEF